MFTSTKTLILSILIGILLLLGAGYLGFLYGKKQTKLYSVSSPANQVQTVQTQASPIGPKTLVKEQQALVQGTITAVNADLVTVRANDGTEGSFKLSKNAVIYPLSSSPSGHLTIGTRNKNAIKLNQKANIVLKLIDNLYQIINISYIK